MRIKELIMDQVTVMETVLGPQTHPEEEDLATQTPLLILRSLLLPKFQPPRKLQKYHAVIMKPMVVLPAL